MGDLLKRNLRKSLLLVGSLVVLGAACLERPGFGQEPPWITFLFGGVLTVWCGFELMRGGFAQRASQVAFLLFVFWGQRILSCFQSIDHYRSEVNLISWTVGFAIFFSLLLSVENLTQWRVACGAMITLASILSCYGLAVGPPGVPFSDSATFSLIPVIAVFLSFGLDGQYDSVFVRWFLRGVRLMLVIAALGTGSRAAAIALGLGLLILVLLSSLETRTALLAFALLLGALLVLQGPSDWLGLLKGARESDLPLRQLVLENGWTIAQSRPVLGSGPGTFALAFQQYRPINCLPQSLYVKVAHNDYIETAVESGVIGLALWLLVLCLALYRGYRSAWFSELGDEPAAVTAALVAAVTFSLLNFALAVPALLLWILALLALTVCIPASPDFRKPWPLAGYLAVGATFILSGLWVAYFSWLGLRVSLELRNARLAGDASQINKAVGPLDRAAQLLPGRWDVQYQRALLLKRLSEEQGDPSALKSAEKAILRARAASPHEVEVLALMGDIYLDLGEYSKAEEAFRRGAELAPYSSRFPGGLIQVFLKCRDYRAAIKSAMRLYLVDESQLDRTVDLMIKLGEQSSDFPAEALDMVELPDKRLERLALKTEQRLSQAGLHRAADKVRGAWRKGHPDEHTIALEQIRRMEMSGQADEAYWRLDDMVNQSSKDSRDRADVLYEWAIRATRRGQVSAVVKRLRDTLKADPSRVRLRLFLISHYRDSGQAVSAEALVEEGLNLDKNDPDLLLVKAQLAYGRGDTRQAAVYARKVLALQASNEDAAHLLRLIETVDPD